MQLCKVIRDKKLCKKRTAHKPLSTDLSAYQNRAAYQTPKNCQVAKKHDEKKSRQNNVFSSFYVKSGLGSHRKKDSTLSVPEPQQAPPPLQKQNPPSKLIGEMI